MIKIEHLETTIYIDKDGYSNTPDESFYDALTTRKKSVICNPDYGTDFVKRKHRNLDSSTLIDFRRDFKNACSFDPRLNFQDVKYDLVEMSIGVVRFDVYLSVGIISGRLVA